MTQQTQFLMTKNGDIINITSGDLATYLAAGWTPVNIRYSEGGEESDTVSQVLMTNGSDAIRVLPDSVLTYEAQGYTAREIRYGANAVRIFNVTVDESMALPYVASARLLLELEADSLDLDDDDPVSTWADQSGNGRDFTQTGTARPTRQTVGGYPVVAFDGVNDWLEGSNFADNLDSFTVFIAGRVLNGSAVLSKINNIGSGAGWLIGTGSNGLLTQEDGGNVYSWLNIGDFSWASSGFVFAAVFTDKNNFASWVNGTNPTQTMHAGTVADMTTSEPLRIGSDGVGGDDGFMLADIHAILLYASAPDATDRAAIEAWLAARYGITL